MLVLGLALLVLPGPAFLVIPAGLAILATEFVWARRWLRKSKAWVHRQKRAMRTRGASKTVAASPPVPPSPPSANKDELLGA